MAFFSKEELDKLGFGKLGVNVSISRKASIYRPDKITLGNNVRIDDFCVLSAGDEGIEIGDYIHIGVYSCLIGKGKIVLSDFCNISSKVSVYSSNDDYSGAYMTNPMVPERFTHVTHASVDIGRHVIIGSGSVILPGTCISDGSAIGALSLVQGTIPPSAIYAGIPAKFIRERKVDIFNWEHELRKDT
jgi:acetyltransferase-like isoleucine patch superfamily enzyme